MTKQQYDGYKYDKVWQGMKMSVTHWPYSSSLSILSSSDWCSARPILRSCKPLQQKFLNTAIISWESQQHFIIKPLVQKLLLKPSKTWSSRSQSQLYQAAFPQGSALWSPITSPDEFQKWYSSVSSVTLNYHVTKIVMNLVSQLSELSKVTSPKEGGATWEFYYF